MEAYEIDGPMKWACGKCDTEQAEEHEANQCCMEGVMKSICFDCADKRTCDIACTDAQFCDLYTMETIACQHCGWEYSDLDNYPETCERCGKPVNGG